MSDLTCDVAVIGAGTAGIAAERNARKHGAKTLLIDPEFAGTVCATVGCMPSKLLIAAAHAAYDARMAGAFGIRIPEVNVDGPAIMRRLRDLRDDFVASTRKTIDDLPDGTAIKARARFTDATTLALDDGRTVKANAVIIATGSAPMVPPPYRGLGDRLLTNRNIFELKELPPSLAVIGGGAIGLEMAQAMARLGVRVTLYDQGDTLAGVRCPKVHARLKEVMAREISLHLGTDPQPSLVDAGARIKIDRDAQTFDKVLVATGRPPTLEGLNIEATGLDLDAHGVPKVNPETMQCGTAPIFIAGDAADLRPVLHEASAEGAIAGRNAIAYPAVVRSDRAVPFTITFTDPPVVSIGAEPDDSAKIGSSDYENQGRARVDNRNTGLVRLYAAAPDGRLIGADLFCPGAEHLGHLLAWAIESRHTASDLLNRPFYHPTLEEGLHGALREICAAVPLPTPGERDTGNPPGV